MASTFTWLESVNSTMDEVKTLIVNQQVTRRRRRRQHPCRTIIAVNDVLELSGGHFLCVVSFLDSVVGEPEDIPALRLPSPSQDNLNIVY